MRRSTSAGSALPWTPNSLNVGHLPVRKRDLHIFVDVDLLRPEVHVFEGCPSAAVISSIV